MQGKSVYVSQTERFVRLSAHFDDPSEFTKAQALMFANEWNRKNLFSKAWVGDDSRLCLELELKLNWIPQTGGFKEVFCAFKDALLWFAKEMRKATRQSDDSELRSSL